ncbi:hypothetical protein TB2_033679 [Malus domestica]
MSSVCAEQHKFHLSHQLLSRKKTFLRDTNIDIPLRKLLTRRIPQEFSSSDVYATADYGSPRFSFADEALIRKFLPYNTGSDDSDDDEVDPYCSDLRSSELVGAPLGLPESSVLAGRLGPGRRQSMDANEVGLRGEPV